MFETKCTEMDRFTYLVGEYYIINAYVERFFGIIEFILVKY